MSTQRKLLLGIATAISLTATSAAMADDVQQALNKDSLNGNGYTLNNVQLKRINNPRTIQDHVNNFQLEYQERTDVQTIDIAAMEETLENGWRRNLGNPVKI